LYIPRSLRRDVYSLTFRMNIALLDPILCDLGLLRTASHVFAAAMITEGHVFPELAIPLRCVHIFSSNKLEPYTKAIQAA
jgi:hypothetical protein